MTGFAYWLKQCLNQLTYLAAHWRLDERTGLSVIDFSRNANTGTITGAAHAQGIIDYCLSFNGTTDHVNCGHLPSLQITESISIEAFINIPDIIGFKGITDKWWDGSFRHLDFEITTNNLFVKLSSPTGGDDVSFGGTLSTILANAWTHVAITWNKQKIYLYIDGIQDPTSATKTTSMSANNADLKLGKGWNGYMNGLIDNVIIYNRALSPEEIKTHSQRRYPL